MGSAEKGYLLAFGRMADHDIREHFASLARLRGRLSDVQEKRKQSTQVDQDITNVTAGLARAKDEWETWTLEQKRSFIRLISDNITLDVVSDRWMKLTIAWSPVVADYSEVALFLHSAGTGIWTAQEDALLREFYPCAPRSALLTALPHRSWTSFKSRARALGITRQSRVRGESSLLETLALEDYHVMQEYGITEQQIAAGQTVFWTIEAAVKQDDLLEPNMENLVPLARPE